MNGYQTLAYTTLIDWMTRSAVNPDGTHDARLLNTNFLQHNALTTKECLDAIDHVYAILVAVDSQVTALRADAAQKGYSTRAQGIDQICNSWSMDGKIVNWIGRAKSVVPAWALHRLVVFVMRQLNEGSWAVYRIQRTITELEQAANVADAAEATDTTEKKHKYRLRSVRRGG